MFHQYTARQKSYVQQAKETTMASLAVPVDGGQPSMYALELACGAAAQAGDEVRAIYVVRVPPQLPIGAELPAERARAEAVLEQAATVAACHDVPITTVVIQARRTGEAIVEAARDCACLMVGQPEHRHVLARWLGGRTLRYILAHAPCQVLVSYAPAADAGGAMREFALVPAAEAEADDLPANVSVLAWRSRTREQARPTPPTRLAGRTRDG
jgi:nucleotide-binding universal stress UspA family protein